jgi:hypothetical protein
MSNKGGFSPEKSPRHDTEFIERVRRTLSRHMCCNQCPSLVKLQHKNKENTCVKLS